MATTGTQQANPKAPNQAALGKDVARRGESPSATKSPGTAHKLTGYGLPCAQCHLYYPADLDVCPTCKHSQRVSPVAPKLPPRPVQPSPEPIPNSAEVEHEREEFLRQFKAQLLESHAETAHAPEEVCKFAEHHPGEQAPAEICVACYERLQERVDVLEAALHIDLKDAAQIVYDAVWADSSDPSKTYENAACALLAEIRKRAGIASVLSPFQPLEH